MFVKKLVEKASLKKPGGSSDGLKPDDINPRLVLHYGIPSGSVLFGYDSIQKILAIATKDGRIKLFGKDGTQALLESPERIPSKFLQFMENQGILVNINGSHHIEVWDVDNKRLSHIHNFEREITSFMAVQRTPYMFVGDSRGDVSVLKLDQEVCNIELMKYRIPYSASHGNSSEVTGDTAVAHILPQPSAESKRVIIIYRDGQIVIWSIQESKAIFKTGGTSIQSSYNETKQVTAACFACPFGSKLVVGYNNGEIFIWSIPASSNSKNVQVIDKESSEPFTTQSAPICKLNLGYKLDKIPISKLRWAYADGKSSRLYVMGSSDVLSANLIQILLLNEHIETRTIKLGLHPPESCIDFDLITSFGAQSKQKSDVLFLLGKSGHVYTYDDSSIERYLLQSQSRSSPSLPKEVMVKLPFADARITVALFLADSPCMRGSVDQDYTTFSKDILPLFPFQTRLKDASISNSSHVGGFSKAKNLYITGHTNGAINFWDISCPLLSPIVSLTQQTEDDLSLSGVPLTALSFSIDLRLLISGDQNGMIRIYKLKSEAFIPESSFFSLPGGSKKGSNHIIKSVKLVKVNGAVLSINTGHNTKHLAVGSDQGYVSLIDLDGLTILYQRHVASEISAGVISLLFETCSFHGFDKNILMVATKDSSVLALESDTGNTLSSTMVRPKTPSRALSMQILDGFEMSDRGSNILDLLDMSKGTSDNVSQKQQLLLLCSERAVYVYSLSHAVQGIKKVLYKKKFQSATCCWASTFESPEAGLILLLSTGKIEIRSLPELSLLREISVRGLTPSTPKANSIPDSSVCSSHYGDLIMVGGDQEVFFVSVLLQKEAYRFLEFASQVYDRDLVVPHGTVSTQMIHKEKKKGIFSSVIKDITGAKAKNRPEIEAEDTTESFEGLSTIFSVANFPSFKEREENFSKDKDDFDLDLDDIKIDDPGERPKGKPAMAAFNKQNITNTFQAIKGKWKHMKVKTDKTPTIETPEDDKAGAVDQIKKRYGYASTSPNEASVASMAKTKLSENLRKLQRDFSYARAVRPRFSPPRLNGVSLKTTEMQDSAQSFSAMAKEVLRLSENDKRSP